MKNIPQVLAYLQHFGPKVYGIKHILLWTYFKTLGPKEDNIMISVTPVCNAFFCTHFRQRNKQFAYTNTPQNVQFCNAPIHANPNTPTNNYNANIFLHDATRKESERSF